MIRHKKDKGIFPVLEKMPCRPRQIKIEPYTLPTVFDCNLEAEEAAARIIFFSQRKNKWVGVSWQHLLAIMKDDIAANNHRFALKQQVKYEERRWDEQQRRWYHSLCSLFRRLRSWFSPANPKEPDVPVSGIYSYGLPFMRHGLRFLLNGQWLRQEIHRGNTVYFPTAKLIGRVMRKQGIIAK
ncbi:MAG: hypothetical protein ABIH36_03425 [bacterium]